MAERIVIVGANAAGTRAAEALRAGGCSGGVVMIDADPELPYERPPLSKGFLRGAVGSDEMRFKPAAFYAERGIEVRLGVAASGLDPARRVVSLADGTAVPFDLALIATGSRPRRLPVPGSDLDGVLVLRTLADAERLRRALAGAGRVVVVGGGFIGMEVAATCRLLGLTVTVLEAGPAPLSRALGEALGARIARLHEARGVEVLVNQGVAGFEGRGRVERVVLADGRRLDADVVVVGVGVEPAIAWLEGAGLDLDGGVVADEFGRTSVEGVFVAGDVAAFWHPGYRARLRLEHFDHARAHGAAVAQAMLGGGTPYAPVPSFWSDQYDWTIQQVGLPEPGAMVVDRGDPTGTAWSAFFLVEGRVAGAVGLNRPRDISAAHRLVAARVAVDPAVLADEAVDMRALAREIAP